MSDKRTFPEISRRRTLQGAGTLALGGGIVGTALSRSTRAGESVEFVIEQPDRCLSIEPLTGTRDVVDLYSDVTTDTGSDPNLGRTDTSRLFLYDGPNGYSIVLIHGGGNDSGRTIALICGLPAEGRWVVLNDSSGDTRDSFDLNNQGAVLNWVWGRQESEENQDTRDGGVFRGLGHKFCLSIRSVFDKPAGDDSPSQTTSWQALSGDIDDPDVINLDSDKPLTVRTGTCDTQPAACTLGEVSVDDPIHANVTFCCTAVAVESKQYDCVHLNFLDGTDQRFEGPFTGFNTFLADDDNDGNAKDEIIRTITITRDEDVIKIENPNFKQCLATLKEGSGPEYGGY